VSNLTQLYKAVNGVQGKIASLGYLSISQQGYPTVLALEVGYPAECRSRVRIANL